MTTHKDTEVPTRSYKDHLREQIINAEEATGYLSACYAEGPETFALAVRDVWEFARVDPPAAPTDRHRFQRGGRVYDQMCGLCNAVADAPIHQLGDIERAAAKTTAPAAPDERNRALEDRLWEALKQHSCKKPDEAKLIVFLSERKFREATGPLLATVRKETWERAIHSVLKTEWNADRSSIITTLESAAKQER